MMPDLKQPLLALFYRLRQADIPLGMDDYALLLRALQAGRGLADREALARLCRALWLKSANPRQLHLFRFHFDQVIPLTFRGLPVGDSQPAVEPTPPGDEPPGAAVEQDGDETEETGVAPEDLYRDEEPEQTPEQLVSQFIEQNVQALREVDDEVQAARAQEQLAERLALAGQSYFNLSRDYLPVTRRQMKQNWRYLRRATRDGPPVELDVEATINQIAREGLFLNPVLRPRRVNRTELVLLLDYGGSMVPFHGLARRLADTAQRGGRLGQADVYYFHDCPDEYLYKNSYLGELEPLARRLVQMHPLHTSVLIFSDGGAARGFNDSQRATQTRAFLNRLKQAARHVAWLNPMPAVRWPKSTAGQIAQWVPMFEISPLGLQETIKTLRGRRPHAQERR